MWLFGNGDGEWDEDMFSSIVLSYSSKLVKLVFSNKGPFENLLLLFFELLVSSWFCNLELVRLTLIKSFERLDEFFLSKFLLVVFISIWSLSFSV